MHSSPLPSPGTIGTACGWSTPYIAFDCIWKPRAWGGAGGILQIIKVVIFFPRSRLDTLVLLTFLASSIYFR